MAFESLHGRSARSLAQTVGFYLSVVVFLFFWLLAFNFQLYAVFVGWFDPVLADTVHFVHDIALATWVWVWGAAMLVQLYRPAKRVVAMQVALLLTLADFGVGLLAVGLVSVPFDPSVMLFFVPVFVAAALHPARREVFEIGQIDRSAVNPVLLGLAALAVIPVVLYVVGQFDLQATVSDEHAELGHYGTMVYYGLSLLGLSILASLRNRGRRFAAYGAGLLAVMLALASVFQPTMSGLDTLWSALSILWALAFVGAYEWSSARRATRRTDQRSEEPTAMG